MKSLYIKIGFGIIVIWALVLGFPYYHERKIKEMAEIEAFSVSVNGIVTDETGNMVTCSKSQIGQQINGGTCLDLSYVDQNGNINSGKIVSIYSNYYVDPSSGILQAIPYGYSAKPGQRGIVPSTRVAAYDASVNNASTIHTDISGIQYSYRNYVNNLDSIVKYHDDYTDGDYAPDGGGLPIGKMWIKDKDGKLTATSIFDSSFNNPLYYESGSFPYGTKNYVPTYENSVYLSNLSNYTNITNTTLSPAVPKSIGAGFCNNKMDHSIIDIVCSTLDSNTCSSISCCNLLDKGKCVGGNENGPFYPNNANDIVNRDFYYYQGKCYGSCNR